MRIVKTKISLGWIAVAILLVAGPATAKAPSFTLAGKTAIALDADGTPLARASREYLLAWAGNANGMIFEIDSKRQRIRITPDKQAALWLSCTELAKPICGSPKSGQVRTLPGAGDEGNILRALPLCPGDPRCPR